MSHGIVYIIRNRVNEKVYVGATTKSLELRWGLHVSQARGYGRRLINEAMREIGEQHFYAEILESAENASHLDELERRYIQLYHSDEEVWGYNGTSGGRRGFRTAPRIVERSIAKGLKTKSQNQRAKRVRVLISLSQDINAALHDYAESPAVRDSVSTVIRRAVRELLERAGAWPPKPKEGK